METYLVIEEDGEVAKLKEIRFETQMLTENRIDPFLPLLVQNTDCLVRYRYPVTGKCALLQLYEHQEIGAEQLKILIAGIQKGLLAAEEYLLSEAHILFGPDGVYCDPATGSISLCCCPLKDEPPGKGLQELAEFLISVTDHNDPAAIDLSYGFFKMVLAGDYHFAQLMEKKAKTEKTVEEPYLPETPMHTETGEHTGRSAFSILGFAAAFAIIVCFTLCLLLLKFR